MIFIGVMIRCNLICYVIDILCYVLIRIEMSVGVLV